MAENDQRQGKSDEGEEGAVHLRRLAPESDEIDMTPMIDCVFLLLIFFLVNSAMSAMESGIELPPARYGKPADLNRAVVVTMADRGSGLAQSFLGDGLSGEKLPEESRAREARVLRAVQEGRREGKEYVVIKAARTLKHREVSAVAAVVGQVEGTKLYLAVFDGG